MAEEEKVDYTPDLYTLVDEEGVEQTFELLDIMEVDEERYFALVPYYPNADDVLADNGELVILKSQMDGEEEIMVSIDDDEEFDKIGNMFLERIENMFDENDDEDDFE